MPTLPIRFDWSIGPGQLVTAVATSVMALWLVFGQVAKIGMNESAAKSTEDTIKVLRTDLTAQVAALKVEMTAQLVGIQTIQAEQFRSLRSDIANLPRLSVTMEQQDRRQEQTDARVNNLTGRVEVDEKAIIQNSADIVGVLREIGRLQRAPK